MVKISNHHIRIKMPLPGALSSLRQRAYAEAHRDPD